MSKTGAGLRVASFVELLTNAKPLPVGLLVVAPAPL
jgi:hypothetical protein